MSDNRVSRNRSALRLWLLVCVCLAGGCDARLQVLTYSGDDGGVDASRPNPACRCSEQQVCAAGSCIDLPEVTAIAAGDKHTCRVYQGQLWCWGDNEQRQLGLANDAPDVVARPARVGSRSDWLTVAAGSSHTCALREPGVLRCWGDDSQGQLGMSSNSRFRDQQHVPWDDFTQLKCGGDNCCALRSGGSLYCWGANRDGSAGADRDDSAPVEIPTQVAPDRMFLRAFSVGAAHSCAIASDRSLWCWGSNAAGQLGIAGVDKALAPQQVGEAHDWLWVAAGGTQTCGIRRGNILYCWGDNSAGQVGIERVGPDGEPVVTDAPIGVTMTNDWVRVEAGAAHACAIKTSQQLLCWGQGDQGQLGLKDVDVVEVPTRVLVAIDWRELALGAAHSCGLDTSQPQPRMFCWGENDKGQLGQGDMDRRFEPVEVEL